MYKKITLPVIIKEAARKRRSSILPYWDMEVSEGDQEWERDNCHTDDFGPYPKHMRVVSGDGWGNRLYHNTKDNKMYEHIHDKWPRTGFDKTDIKTKDILAVEKKLARKRAEYLKSKQTEKK